MSDGPRICCGVAMRDAATAGSMAAASPAAARINRRLAGTSGLPVMSVVSEWIDIPDRWAPRQAITARTTRHPRLRADPGRIAAADQAANQDEPRPRPARGRCETGARAAANGANTFPDSGGGWPGQDGQRALFWAWSVSDRSNVDVSGSQ